MMTLRHLPLFSLFALLAWSTACSGDSSSSDPDARVVDPPDASPGRDGAADASTGSDAAPSAEPAMLDGIGGRSCAEGCAALGKTCVVACTEHRSCGSHDGVLPPYAGYACYFWENEDGTFRVNDGRSFTRCDEEVSETWENFGEIETLGDYLGGNPVSCCCQ